MDFEKDVFISYAHLDNDPDSLNKDAKGWISNFHTLLQKRLNKVIGDELKVWFDETDLEGNSVFGKEIRDQFPKLKVMVSILTPRYFKSNWCKEEMDTFYKEASKNAGLSVGNLSRIFKIVKTPFNPDEFENVPPSVHEIVNDTLDYKFFIQKSRDLVIELNPEGSVDNPNTAIFMEKLEDVVQGIAKLIKKLNKIDKTPDPDKIIYLAETSNDLEEFREKLIRQLEDTGYHVLPDRKLPNLLKDYTQAVESYIDQSALSLHLISSNNYGAPPEGTIKSKVIIQNEIAGKKSKINNLNRLIWIPPATTDVDTDQEAQEMQNAFLKKLKEAKSDDSQLIPEILDGKTMQEFSEAINEKIKAIENAKKAKKEAEEKALKDAQEKEQQAAQAKVTGAVTNEVKKVYLICSSADLDSTGPLRKIIKKSGCSVLLPEFEGTAQDLQKQHLDNLAVCDGVIIYYGAGNDLWTDKKASDIQGLIRDPAKPILSKAIYTTGEDDDDSKKEYTNPGIDIINGLEGFKEELFADFLQKLK